MSLREELAAVLWEARWKRIETGSGIKGNRFPDIDDVGQRAWLDVADECIRQMEWARASSPGKDYGRTPPLTLAPEDWKPQ